MEEMLRIIHRLVESQFGESGTDVMALMFASIGTLVAIGKAIGGITPMLRRLAERTETKVDDKIVQALIAFSDFMDAVNRRLPHVQLGPADQRLREDEAHGRRPPRSNALLALLAAGICAATMTGCASLYDAGRAFTEGTLIGVHVVSDVAAPIAVERHAACMDEARAEESEPLAAYDACMSPMTTLQRALVFAREAIAALREALAVAEAVDGDMPCEALHRARAALEHVIVALVEAGIDIPTAVQVALDAGVSLGCSALDDTASMLDDIDAELRNLEATL